MTTSTLTVTEFVLARIAEDEAPALSRAKAREDEPYWTVDPAMQSPSRDGLVVTGYLKTESPEDRRVLAQCAAMRKIVEAVDPAQIEFWMAQDLGMAGPLLETWQIRTLCALASIWSDHPDWREEWRA